MTQEVSLVGVYDADGSLSGEVRYWIGARLGRAHCSLCEITHGLFREKSDWKDCRRELNAEFTTFHRDDAPADVLEACEHQLPVVVARRGSDLFVLLGPGELESLGGDVETFHAALVTACAQHGITLG